MSKKSENSESEGGFWTRSGPTKPAEPLKHSKPVKPIAPVKSTQPAKPWLGSQGFRSN
jgi:hypothetical protein